MTVLHLLSKKDYDTVAKSKLVVIHFFAEWVDQCQHMNNVLDEMAKQKEFKEVFFTKILAEQVPEVSKNYKISAVPTFVIVTEGREVARVEGANPSQLSSKLTDQVMALKQSMKIEAKVSAPKIETSPAELNERLNMLINTSPVMLFMKGNADQPRCGFSKKIVEILREYKVLFKTFDILNDQEVREGLKTYSKWPTYPQLYINGELIGGLDIVNELVASGSLKEMLPKKYTIEERLKNLTKKSNVMVFMKGNRAKPKCGFSRQLVEILNTTDTKYETFDILEDEDVRQELKKFSNWPTYPQIYVNGELVGGLDIIKEHAESGELNNVLNP